MISLKNNSGCCEFQILWKMGEDDDEDGDEDIDEDVLGVEDVGVLATMEGEGEIGGEDEDD